VSSQLGMQVAVDGKRPGQIAQQAFTGATAANEEDKKHRGTGTVAYDLRPFICDVVAPGNRRKGTQVQDKETRTGELQWTRATVVVGGKEKASSQTDGNASRLHTVSSAAIRKRPKPTSRVTTLMT
jgi:hypothetical protein